MRTPLRVTPGLALVGMLGALALAGCGSGSHSSSTVTVTSTASTAPSAATNATATAATSTAAASTTAPHVPAPSHKAAPGGSRAGAPNAYDGVPFQIHTASMTPTYQPETTVYYDPTRTRPRIGDVIIFFLPAGAATEECGSGDVGGAPCRYPAPGLTKKLEMKRVVGLPGDTLVIRRGRVTRNGRPEPEAPTVACGAEAGCEFPKPFTVPAGHYYVMSDDRQLYQEDSRVWGALPQQAIVGTVLGS